MAENNNNQGPINTGSIPEEERLSELSMLKNSWDMYEKTKNETISKRTTATDKSGNKVYSEASTKKTIELLETMQDDIKAKYLALGGSVEDLVAKKQGRKKTATNNSNKKELLKKILEKEKIRIANGETDSPEEEDKDVFTMEVKRPDAEDVVIGGDTEDVSFFAQNAKEEEIGVVNIDITKAKGNNIKYDVIPLPSKGQCYKNKMSKIPVAYLTAYDENMIISPNMYKDGTFLDHILSAKIMTDEIDPMDMLVGDRDAVILWLRASGYGTDFPISATDPNTGQQFESTVDLTKLEYKPFKLRGDANGYFDFTLPFSKDKVKFRFLTYRDIKTLEKMEEDEVTAIKISKINELGASLEDMVNDDDEMKTDTKLKLTEAAKVVREYADSIKEVEADNLYTHSVTNRLCKSIVSINGVTDKKYIEEYVSFMNVKDSSALRKYITENEPGIDYNIEVKRPESLGGGSLRMFLTIDQYIFLSIA